MVRKPKLDPDEAALFRKSVGEVQPVRDDRVQPARQRPSPVPRQRQRDEAEVRRELLDTPPEVAEVETGEELSFARPGLQHNVLRRLRRGYYSVYAELDLHGLTISAAHEVMATFLDHQQGATVRCIRIVHGKGRNSYQGRPVIKHKLNAWLRRDRRVLAFCSARPADGGTGAIYILLRRR